MEAIFYAETLVLISKLCCHALMNSNFHVHNNVRYTTHTVHMLGDRHKYFNSNNNMIISTIITITLITEKKKFI